MNEETTKLKIELAKSKDYLNMHDVILLSNLSMSTVHRRIKDGFLKPLQQVAYGKLLFTKIEVKRWLEGGVE